MAEVSYIFGDVLTGVIQSEIRLNGVSMKMDLDGGEFRGTFHLDQTGKDNDELISTTIPGRNYVVVERDGVVIGDFIIWTRTYQSQAKVAQLYAIPWKAYTESRFCTADYFATDLEQRNILVDLYELMQVDPNSARVQLPDTFPTIIPKSLEVIGTDYKTYRQIIDSIADTSDGFDWMVRTYREGNIGDGGSRYVRWLDIGYPMIGALPSANMPTFEYTDHEGIQGGNIINYWINDSMGSGATNFYGIGAGEGSSMLNSEIVLTDLLLNGFPRYDASLDRKDVTDQAILNGLTFQHAQLYSAPTGVLTVEVKGSSDPAFGDYGIGDNVQLVIKDARFPVGHKRTTRVLGWDYYPQEDSNVEFARLTFEGEE